MLDNCFISRYYCHCRCSENYTVSFNVVGVVQWLERQIVVLDVEGSNPFTHPNL